MTRPDGIDPDLDLVLERTVDVRPELVWKCWTEARHLVHWFTPRPWQTIDCQIDLRPGGIFSTTMRSPEGEVMPSDPGCILDVVENRRFAFTDALGPGWRPKAQGFFTAIILIEPHGPKGTRYTAIAKHVDAAGRQQHADMGFLNGWGTALDQLVEHARRL